MQPALPQGRSGDTRLDRRPKNTDNRLLPRGLTWRGTPGLTMWAKRAMAGERRSYHRQSVKHTILRKFWLQYLANIIILCVNNGKADHTFALQ